MNLKPRNSSRGCRLFSPSTFSRTRTSTPSEGRKKTGKVPPALKLHSRCVCVCFLKPPCCWRWIPFVHGAICWREKPDTRLFSSVLLRSRCRCLPSFVVFCRVSARVAVELAADARSIDACCWPTALYRASMLSFLALLSALAVVFESVPVVGPGTQEKSFLYGN